MEYSCPYAQAMLTRGSEGTAVCIIGRLVTVDVQFHTPVVIPPRRSPGVGPTASLHAVEQHLLQIEPSFPGHELCRNQSSASAAPRELKSR
jgi:hypothetical protein